jgi:hypothetical protein
MRRVVVAFATVASLRVDDAVEEDPRGLDRGAEGPALQRPLGPPREPALVSKRGGIEEESLSSASTSPRRLACTRIDPRGVQFKSPAFPSRSPSAFLALATRRRAASTAAGMEVAFGLMEAARGPVSSRPAYRVAALPPYASRTGSDMCGFLAVSCSAARVEQECSERIPSSFSRFEERTAPSASDGGQSRAPRESIQTSVSAFDGHGGEGDATNARTALYSVLVSSSSSAAAAASRSPFAPVHVGTTFA